MASAQGLRAILWPNDDPRRVPGVADAKKGSNSVIESTIRQLDEYFAGTRHEFDVPLDAVGTEFQHSVWQVLRSIPYGETMSYGEQATVLGDPNKARAVGTANGRNPISIVVPCHRVIGSGGTLVGFAGGLDKKQILLSLEQSKA